MIRPPVKGIYWVWFQGSGPHGRVFSEIWEWDGAWYRPGVEEETKYAEYVISYSGPLEAPPMPDPATLPVIAGVHDTRSC